MRGGMLEEAGTDTADTAVERGVQGARTGTSDGACEHGALLVRIGDQRYSIALIVWLERSQESVREDKTSPAQRDWNSATSEPISQSH